ncbi:MAG: LamG domain-containing protein [Bacteroidota bacterium]|nr:LamG domain-containing protein [Bacteroidota bacterium]
METFLNRNFKVRGDISCFYNPGASLSNLQIANIEVQLWHKTPMQVTLLGQGITNSQGEFIIEFEVDSPVDYIVDGKIKNAFLEAFYNGEKLIINEPSPLLTGLVAYWKLDGDSTDSVNSHNGADTSITYSGINGIINDGGGFNGSTSKILVPDSDDWNMGDGEFSISIWVKRDGLGQRDFFGQIDSAGNDSTLSFGLKFNSSDFLIAFFGIGSLITLTSIASITDDNWHHVIFIRRVNMLYLYLDAIEQDSYDVTGETMVDSTNDLAIGALGEITSTTFSGAIDEVAVWKARGLTDEEINVLYNSGEGLQYPF